MGVGGQSLTYSETRLPQPSSRNSCLIRVRPALFTLFTLSTVEGSSVEGFTLSNVEGFTLSNVEGSLPAVSLSNPSKGDKSCRAVSGF
jgi:hypothetical protein